MVVGLPICLAALTAFWLNDVAETTSANDTLRVQLSELKKRLAAPGPDGMPQDMSAIYLKGGQASLASANLQQLVVATVQNSAGQLIETRAIETESQSETGVTGLNVSLDVSNNSLLQFLVKIETGLPLLSVDAISIRGSVPADPLAEPQLRVDMTVKGFWKAETQ